MIYNCVFLKCDDCAKTDLIQSKERARAMGWHFDRDGEHCYCAKCAPFHRDIKPQSSKKGDAVLTFGFGI